MAERALSALDAISQYGVGVAEKRSEFHEFAYFELIIAVGIKDIVHTGGVEEPVRNRIIVGDFPEVVDDLQLDLDRNGETDGNDLAVQVTEFANACP